MKNQVSNQSAAPSDKQPFAEQIASNLQQLLELSREPLSSAVFYQRLLEIVIASLKAQSGAIWKTSLDKSETIAVHSENETPFDQDEFSADRPGLIKTFLTQDSTQYLLRPGSASANLEGHLSDAESLSFSAHLLMRDDHTAVVLELINPGNTEWVRSSSFTTIIGAVRELATDFHRNSEIQFLKNQNQLCNSLIEFSQRIHGSLDLEPLLYEIANESCQLFHVDRAAIYRRRANQYKLAVVSGISNASSSAQACKAMEATVSEVVKCGLPFQHHSSDLAKNSVPSDSSLGSYFDRSNCSRFIAIPLNVGVGGEPTSPADPWGILVLENFGPYTQAVSAPLLETALEQINQSLANSYRYQRGKHFGPVGPLAAANSFSKNPRIKRFGVLAVAIAICVITLFLVSVDFEIKTAGQILPRQQLRIFSPANGEIVEVYAQQNSTIEANEPLLRIHDAELELRLSRIQGERLATVEKLQAIESRRISGRDNTDSGRDPDKAVLSATAEELRILLNSQLEQIEIMKEQREKLTLRSPVQGKVTTWQFGKLLESRPVQQGQLLMTVADIDGAWNGEVEIRDYRVGHVLSAMEGQDDLPVSFVLVSNPDQEHHGHLFEIARSTEEDLLGNPIVRGIARVDWKQDWLPRPGAKIVAKIHCGRKSLAYVWFHEPIAAIRAAFF
ncbi:MAG: hypothetical protein ACI87E_003494 [Mariniblastus sp.]|jgi:hypothetical protein